MEDIHDIRGPIKILPLWQEYLPHTLILLALLALIAAFFYYKKHKSKPLPSNIIPLTPYEIASQELNAAKKYIQSGMDKTLAIALSDIIRPYIQSTFAFQTSSETSDEFLNEIKNNSLFEGKTLQLLASFLIMCDLAKFAKQAFSQKEQEDLHNKAQRFLEAANQLHLKLAAAQSKPSSLPRKKQ